MTSQRIYLAGQTFGDGMVVVKLKRDYTDGTALGIMTNYNGGVNEIRTVAEFGVMGRAAVEEGRALLAHFASDHLLGVTGYSMGGNTAALIGALMDQPVAIAGLAASHSPGPVWLDGILVSMIDWDALGGAHQADRLRGYLTAASALAVPPPPHTAGAVIVGGRRDGYIPRTAIEDLHAHWPGSELRWLPGGHATMIWRQKDALVDAIVASLDRLYGRSNV